MTGGSALRRRILYSVLTPLRPPDVESLNNVDCASQTTAALPFFIVTGTFSFYSLPATDALDNVCYALLHTIFFYLFFYEEWSLVVLGTPITLGPFLLVLI